jgi:hypothetical protein
MAGLAFAYILLLAYLHHTTEADIQRFLGGSVALSAFRNANRVDAYRIEKPADPSAWSGSRLEDFSVTKGPVPVSSENVQTLRRTLQDRNLYNLHMTKGCIPLPGVRLDFTHDDERLSVLLCFECDLVQNFLNGKLVGGGNSDNMRPSLLHVVRALFPDDQKIQSLTEQH